jgi:hypothetical protein
MNKAQIIKFFRQNYFKINTLELQERKEKWIQKLQVNNWNPNVSFYEIYPYLKGDIIKSKSEESYIPRFANTRTILQSEVIIEIDKLPLEKAVLVMCEFMSELIREKLHFAAFYAEGQRSPHIRIYDFDELKELSPFQREKAKAQFIKSLCPFLFHLVDVGINSDNHFVPLEFALHWKYGTPFNLLFEWKPEEEICKD